MKPIEDFENKIICADCLDILKEIPDKSIDMILCDLPYGTTACKWDTIIPFKPLWKQYERLIKDKGAIVLTASQPFTSALIMSNSKLFKYEWIWVKNNAVGFVNAKLKPMNKHENILVFSKGKTSNRNENNMIYNPQNLVSFNKISKNGHKKNKENTYWRPSSKSCNGGIYVQEFTNYPTTDIYFDKEKAYHPTQKPVALFEYLIKTYTNEGDIVLDNCIGSGTTAVACKRTGRNFIGIEKERRYCELAEARIAKFSIRLSEFQDKKK